MNTIPRQTKFLNELPMYCWIKKEENWRLHAQGKKLPLIKFSKENEDILKKLNASYRVVKMNKGYMYEYWDTNKYETEELTFPAYTYSSEEYQYIGEHTGINPTKETIEAAIIIKEKIKNLSVTQPKEETQIYEGEMEEILKQILDGKESKYIFSLSFEDDEEYVTEENHFYVFVVKRKDGTLTGHVMIFNKNKMLKSKIKIEVPKKFAGYINGRGGCNTEKWRKKMRLQHIEVLGI